MTRLLLAVGLAAAVGAVAYVLQRRRPGIEPVVERHHVPTGVDRADFLRPETAWLVVVFTSATCDTCAATWEVARQLESPAVATQEVEAKRDKSLHDRYGIDAVPTTIVCDAEGGVSRSFLGPVSATHLWAAVAEARNPGSIPPGCGTGESA
ncbi:MAG TPA: hypothetical protein VFU85_12210 [Nocardioides sp.]|nr:hypothetical protein [Nocardioides sp.]